MSKSRTSGHTLGLSCNHQLLRAMQMWRTLYPHSTYWLKHLCGSFNGSYAWKSCFLNKYTNVTLKDGGGGWHITVAPWELGRVRGHQRTRRVGRDHHDRHPYLCPCYLAKGYLGQRGLSVTLEKLPRWPSAESAVRQLYSSGSRNRYRGAGSFFQQD